jgi:hypothetical protein
MLTLVRAMREGDVSVSHCDENMVELRHRRLLTRVTLTRIREPTEAQTREAEALGGRYLFACMIPIQAREQDAIVVRRADFAATLRTQLDEIPAGACMKVVVRLRVGNECLCAPPAPATALARTDELSGYEGHFQFVPNMLGPRLWTIRARGRGEVEAPFDTVTRVLYASDTHDLRCGEIVQANRNQARFEVRVLGDADVALWSPLRSKWVGSNLAMTDGPPLRIRIEFVDAQLDKMAPALLAALFSMRTVDQ